jgi:phospholipid-binding lipoprotein MlaA
VRFVNCLLQGKNASAGKELHRFAINTTEGVLGFGDPARDKHGLEPAGEDLGQTLATYGVGDGVYIVWPLLGPSTVRDSVGMVGDQFLNPVRYIDHRKTSISVTAGRIINERSLTIGEYESFKASAIDPYIALRQAYIQYRKEQIEK